MNENITVSSGTMLPAVENLQKMLNQFPPDNEVQVNKHNNEAKYIPIAIIERLLDEFYAGLWQTDNFRTEVIANEVVGSINLKVFHPVIKMWITRTGVASVMILTRAGKPVTIENKIPNTLVTNYPKLKAECIKNAAKSLGVRFGRALNRGDMEEYSYLSEQVTAMTTTHARLVEILETAKVSKVIKEKIVKRLPRMTVEALNKTIIYLEGKQ